MNVFKVVIYCSFIWFPLCGWGQSGDGNFGYRVDAFATLSSGEHTPFWLVANRHGFSSIAKNNFAVSAGIFKEHNKNPFSYAFGLELAVAERFTSTFVVKRAYADIHYRAWELSVGSKERGSELKNDRLSTGGMTFSANARPIPQVRISVPQYRAIPGARSWLHFKGHIAYGLFTDDHFQKEFAQGKSRYTQDAWYHSKAGFLKVEHKRFPLIAEVGMEMAAQFGGDCYYPDGTVLPTPNKLIDFLRVFIPMRGGEGASESDQINILGNHLGSYHLSLGYRFADWKVRGYYEHYFEDGSGMMMKNRGWRDCLAGLEVTFPKNPLVSTVVYEYLYTKNQTGPFHYFASDDIPYTFTGADNYYNNGQYAGWEHWGQGIGNPLLFAPLYNEDGDLSFKSNRVKGFHLGIEGSPLLSVSYRLLMSFARHWGTYGSPYRDIMNNKNALLEVKYSPERLKGWQFTLSTAIDGGNLVGKSWGGMLSVCRTGLIGKIKKRN